MIRTRAGYTRLLYLMLPYALLHPLWRALREPAYLRHLPERLGRYPDAAAERTIWIHAVSVGETRAAQPLIEGLLERYPEHRLLLTHMTPTGRAAGEALYGDRVRRCYLPWDLPGAVARFLDRFRPEIGVLMETEVWFNLIHACAERGIPVHLANARLSERSLRRYERIRELACAGLNELAAIAAQTPSDAERFAALGARNVRVAGNVKFDVTPPHALVERGLAWRAAWGESRPVWLAASTREGEEALILDAIGTASAPDALAVIVPRHPRRFDEVARLLAARGVGFQRRSENAPLAPRTRVLLGDSMGEMFAYYAACDAALIGGSLLPFGSQNLLEACALGKPVVIGPSTYNFEEAARGAIEAGAALRVADAREAMAAIAALLADRGRRGRMGEAGLAFTRGHRGATQRLLELIRLP